MFIAIDGMDGAGKSTLIEQVKEYLEKACNCTVVVHKDFPDKSNPQVQEFLINKGKGSISTTDFQMICIKERIDFVGEYIEDWISSVENGNPRPVYIAGRWVPSGVVYGAIDLVNRFKFNIRQALKVTGYQNDVIRPANIANFFGIVLICDVEVAMNRINRRGLPVAVYETEKALTQAHALLEVFTRNNSQYLLVDTSKQTPQDTFNLILPRLKEYLIIEGFHYDES